MKSIIAFWLACSACSLAGAEEVAISKTETLVFRKPPGFRFEVAQDPDDGFRPSLKFAHFGPGGVKDFGFKLFINKVNAGELESESDVRELAATECEQYKEGFVEGKVSMRKVIGANIGYYCTFSDASVPRDTAPSPGEFRNISIGYVKSGLFGFNVVAYSNDQQWTLFSGFLSTLASLNVVTGK